jgi:zinc protease
MKKFAFIIIALVIGVVTYATDFDVYKLDNGQTVVIQEVKTNPIVTIDTWIKTGSINETDENNGVSHFLEHLFFKGSTNHPAGEFDKILETKGALTNAATSKDFTHYYITIPSKDFDLALEMHSDMLLHPLIPRKELEKERKVVIEEIMKDANSPQTLVYDNLIKMLYTNHPYKRKVIGTSEIISTIHRDKILEYYNQYYNPSNMITIIVGDVDSASVIEKVKKDFNAEFKKPIKTEYPKEKILTTQAKTVDYADVQSGYMLIGFRGTKIDAKESYALDILSTILGDGRSSIFYRNIKENKQLANTISVANTGFKTDGIFYISANFDPSKCTQLQDAIFEEIKNIQKNKVTQEQLQLAKNLIERNTYYERESISNIANEIGYTYVTTDDIKYYENYIENIKKVTADEVKQVANKYLGVEKSAVSIILPEKSKEVKVSNTVQYKPAKLISENSTTQKYELSNGATLLLTPNKVNDIIAISITAKGGELSEQIAGTAQLTASLLTKGTNKYSSIEFAKILDDNGIKIVPSASKDRFSITVLTTKNEYAKTLELLDEVINNATLDDYEIEKSKNDKLNAIKKSKDVPLNIAIDNYKTYIYENSQYANSNSILEKSISKITKANIKNYYENAFYPQNVVISINGNVDNEKTLEEFTKIFNDKKGEKFDYSKYSIPSLKSAKKISTKIKDLKTDWIIMGWQTSGVLERKDYATLQVIDAMLGTGMSSRLFKNLRDKDGLAYQLGSQYSPNILKGSFITYIGTNPENLDYAIKRMQEEVFRLKTEFVSSKELQEAKDKLLGNYIIGQETNLDKATTIGWFEASGRGYNFDNEYAQLINSVTESDIIEVANKYFNNNYVLSIVSDM